MDVREYSVVSFGVGSYKVKAIYYQFLARRYINIGRVYFTSSFNYEFNPMFVFRTI